MEVLTPRTYQREMLEAALEAATEHKRILLIGPTGCGKSVVFSLIARERIGLGRLMAMVHLRTLIEQTYGHLRRATGVMPGVEAGQERADSWWQEWRSPLIVAMIQSLASNDRYLGFDPSSLRTLIIDEAHRFVTAKRRRVINHLASHDDCRAFMFTATPDTTEERDLAKICDHKAYEYTSAQAVNDGYLVPTKSIGLDLIDVDVRRIEPKSKRGDFQDKDLCPLLAEDKVVAAMAYEIDKQARGLKTLVFTAGVQQAEKMANALNSGQYGKELAAWVCGETDQYDRARIFSAFRRGEIMRLIGCGVFTEGFDEPSVQCIAMCRPTFLNWFYQQMLGRGRRTLAGLLDDLHDDNQQHLGIEGESNVAALRRKRIAESDKPYLLVLDFVGNCDRHHVMDAYYSLGAGYSDEVVEEARAEARSNGKHYDVEAHLEVVRQRMERQRVEAERWKQVHVTAEYVARNAVDPFVQQLTSPGGFRESRWNGGRKPTPKMRAFLRWKGLSNEDVDNMSFGQAGRAISAIKARESEKLCGTKHARALAANGFRTDLSDAEAEPLYRVLAQCGWLWPQEEPKPQKFMAR